MKSIKTYAREAYANRYAFERVTIDILDGKEWDSETAESIAEVLRAAGHEIRDPRC